MARLPTLSRPLGSTQVLVRFGLRMLLLLVLAAFASIGFGRSLAALLWMSTLLCAAIGVIRREPLLGGVLNHWDETAAYAALFALVSGLDHAVAA
jgi:hypothetical protein